MNEELIADIEIASSELKELLGGLTETLDAAEGAMQEANSWIDEIHGELLETVGEFSEIVNRLTEDIESSVDGVCQTFEDQVQEIGDALREHVASMADTIADRASNILQEKLEPCWQVLEEGMSDLKQNLTECATEAIAGITHEVQERTQKMGEIFTQEIQDMFTALTDRIRGESENNQVSRADGDRAREEMDAAFKPMEDIVERINDLASEVDL